MGCEMSRRGGWIWAGCKVLEPDQDNWITLGQIHEQREFHCKAPDVMYNNVADEVEEDQGLEI
uniref:Uncharacterized protein n=1 Tax=Octopus bimaculoides TaxID=37653 RepID=A0A0L8H276_OCTBM